MSRRILFILTIGALSIAGVTFAAVQYFSYSAGSSLPTLADPMSPFYSDNRGNAGTVGLGVDVDGHSSAPYLDNNILKGTVWLQAAGVATFNSDAQIVPPTSGPASLAAWSVVGTMTSPNVGTIRLSGADTSLTFNPVTQRLEGYGYNDGLGRVWFGGVTTDLAGTGAGFLGRVKIIGNAGGTTIYDTLYSQGVKFNASMFNTTLQRVRKNIGLLSRNIGPQYNNSTFPTSPKALVNKIFYINATNTPQTAQYSLGNLKTQFESSSIQSLIIIGGDLIIDSDIGNSSNIPKGIIVLKNENGIGGNIYIAGNVKTIKSSLLAEGSVYSGENSISLYNSTMTRITMLPETQLYVFGSLISRNTIGGAAQSSAPVCPFNASVSCDYETSIRYDLNYFRDYRKNPTGRAYTKNNTLENYSVILEYDSRVLSAPPPGLE